MNSILERWEVIWPSGVNVRLACSSTAASLGIKKQGQCVYGFRRDAWLHLSGEPGFILIVNGDATFLRKLASAGHLKTWEVMSPSGVHVRRAATGSSASIGMVQAGIVVSGYQLDSWLALSGESGFIKISDGDESYLHSLHTVRSASGRILSTPRLDEIKTPVPLADAYQPVSQPQGDMPYASLETAYTPPDSPPPSPYDRGTQYPWTGDLRSHAYMGVHTPPTPSFSPIITPHSLSSFSSSSLHRVHKEPTGPVQRPTSCHEDDVDMAERTFGEPGRLEAFAAFRAGGRAPSREWDPSRPPFDPRELHRSNSKALKRLGSRELKNAGAVELRRSRSLELARAGPMDKGLKRADSSNNLKEGPLVRVLQRGLSGSSMTSLSGRGGKHLNRSESHESILSYISSKTDSKTDSKSTTGPEDGLSDFCTNHTSFMQPISKFNRTATSLEEWYGFIPDNLRFTRMFSEVYDEDLTLNDVTLTLVLLFLAELPRLVLFSDLCTADPSFRGLQVHYWLLEAGYYRLGVSCAAIFSLFALHFSKWRTWSRFVLTPISIILILQFMAVPVLFVHAYPHAPLVVSNFIVPAVIAFIRTRLVRCKASQFYAMLSASCFLIATVIITMWSLWVFRPNSFTEKFHDNYWNRGTEARLRESQWMPHILDEYTSPSWDECLANRFQSSKPLQPDDELACRKVKLTVFLVWFSPIIQATWLLSIATACIPRSLFAQIDVQSNRFDRVLAISVVLAATGFFALWAWASISGESLEASAVVIVSAAAGLLSILTWCYCTASMRQVVEAFETKAWCQAFRPMLVSDYFTSVLLIIFGPFLVIYFAVEFVRQTLFRLRGLDRDRSLVFTKRAEQLYDQFSGWHWGSICENAIFWCWLFLMINIMAVQMAVVFFSWLNAELSQTLNFGAVAVIFYATGLLMLMLPVVPGIPVYLSAGIILVAAAKKDSAAWLSFESGIVIAIAECMILKLNAHILQQKVFGEFLGHWMWIQRLVGVHKVGIRAIKSILKEPGMKRVIILCGGPDWPTSVLTGILQLPVLEMLMGTLPVVFLIAPCVICGAFLLDQHFSGSASILIATMTVCQGGAMLAALVVVLYDVNFKYDELMAWRPELDKILEFARKREMQEQLRSMVTEWRNLSPGAKLCLFASTTLTVIASWCSFLLSSKCFEDFDLSDDLYAPLDKGGLDGDPLNLIKPLGALVLAITLAGILFFIAYVKIVSRTVAQMEQASILFTQNATNSVRVTQANSSTESPGSFADETYQPSFKHKVVYVPGVSASKFEVFPRERTSDRLQLRGTPPAVPAASTSALASEVPDSSNKFAVAAKIPGPQTSPVNSNAQPSMVGHNLRECFSEPPPSIGKTTEETSPF